MGEFVNVTKLPSIPARAAHAHKGTFGTVIVVGGTAMMIGAPALCAAAALRSGSGLVKIAAPQGVVPFAIVIEPSATGIIIGTSVDEDLAQLDAADPDSHAVLAVGPGMGISSESHHFVVLQIQELESGWGLVGSMKSTACITRREAT